MREYSEEYAAFTHGEKALWRGWLGEAEIIGNIFENPELLKQEYVSTNNRDPGLAS